VRIALLDDLFGRLSLCDHRFILGILCRPAGGGGSPNGLEPRRKRSVARRKPRGGFVRSPAGSPATCFGFPGDVLWAGEEISAYLPVGEGNSSVPLSPFDGDPMREALFSLAHQRAASLPSGRPSTAATFPATLDRKARRYSRREGLLMDHDDRPGLMMAHPRKFFFYGKSLVRCEKASYGQVHVF